MRPVPKADNLPPSCAVVTKSGNLNFLEPSGPLQACNGTDFPLLPFTQFVETEYFSKLSTGGGLGPSKFVAQQKQIVLNNQTIMNFNLSEGQGRRLRVASGATAPGPSLEGAPRFRPVSLSSYIFR
jgi:hypothetical protein